MPTNMESDIAEIKRDVKEIALLVKRHDVSLYGQNYDNGLVSDVRDNKRWIGGANKVLWTLTIGFLGQVTYFIVKAITRTQN